MKITLDQAFSGFLLYKKAAGMSPNTIRNYKNTWHKVQAHFGDTSPIFQDLTRDDWIKFLAWLSDDYTTDPDGVAPRGEITLSPKSLCNIHTDLCSLYTWATKTEIVTTNLFRTIDQPRYEPPVIEPYSKEQIEAMLKACEVTRSWKTRDTHTARPTADRDRAILLVLLSTGIRASELCHITLQDLDMAANSIKVAGKGRGRDSKERLVYVGRRTAKALWRYLTARLGDTKPEDPLFLTGSTTDPRPLTRDVLTRLISRLGDRAGVSHAYPHRFRHTFAITYLRNGGDLLTLQKLLGHTDLAMVRHYATIATADCANAHARADPVDNWRL